MQGIRNRLYGALVFTIGTLSIARGQSMADSEPVAPRVTKVLTAASVNYLGLALTQERGIGPQTTVLFGLGTHYSFYSAGSPLLGTRFIDVVDKYFGRDYTTRQAVPYFLTEVRVYTTLFKRSVRGRNIQNNAANYFALVGEVPFATGNLINVLNLALAYPIGVKYGLRRPLGQKFYLEASAGAFLKISAVQQSLQPRLDFSLFRRL